MEEILYEPLPVLDHGFVRVIDYMGDDSAIVQAARVSYGKGTKLLSDDTGLINYLMRHWHTSPFEMCEIKLHVKAADFRRPRLDSAPHRQCQRIFRRAIRYWTRNSTCRRPTRSASQATSNKQGRGEACCPATNRLEVLDMLREDAERNYKDYMWLMNTDE